MAQLAHTLLGTPADGAEEYVFFLHGILGGRSNWRTIARRARERWGARTGAVLVDLRMHGDSQGFSPPHTISAAASDLGELASSLGVPVSGVLGHSFGGKVALAYAALKPPALERLWVVDSSPGPRPDRRGSEGTLAVIALLRELPTTFDRREGFTDAVVERGHDKALAAWLAMNLVRDGERWRWPISLDAIEALLEDYFQRDLWPVLEASGGPRIDVIAGGRSDVLQPEDTARIERAPRAQLHVVEDAAHWVHVNRPDEVLRVLTEP